MLDCGVGEGLEVFGEGGEGLRGDELFSQSLLAIVGMFGGLG